MISQLPKPYTHISLREEFDDWALLYNPDNGKAVGVTPTGVTIWKCLSTGENLQRIKEVIIEEYENPPEDLNPDIQAFFEEIIKCGYAESA